MNAKILNLGQDSICRPAKMIQKKDGNIYCFLKMILYLCHIILFTIYNLQFTILLILSF
jgi:hypothetical protein